MEAIVTTDPVLDLPENKEKAEQQVFYRLTTLWAISEAFLGGVLHAFKLPGTGLFVGGAAVICISLIAWYCPKRSAILKATVLVILVKGMLSPHSPIGAYLAVFIQGSLGYLLFWSKDYFRLSCFALGVLTQLQSALQRLVVLVVLFGSDIYGIANGLVNYILKKAGFAAGDYMYYVIIIYIALHLLMGLVVGWFAGKLPVTLNKARKEHVPVQYVHEPGLDNSHIKREKSPYKQYGLIAAGCFILIVAGFQSVILPGKVWTIIVRALAIITIWHLAVAPVLLFYIKKWSAKRKLKFAAELQVIFQLIPDMKKDIAASWVNMQGIGFWKRLSHFILSALNHLLFKKL